MIRLWLDDIRDPADFGRAGWHWVTSAQAAIDALSSGEVEEASLDHDLEFSHYDGSSDEATGYDVVCWMEEHGVWPKNGVHVHSMNPVGAARMRQVIDRAYRK